MILMVMTTTENNEYDGAAHVHVLGVTDDDE